MSSPLAAPPLALSSPPAPVIVTGYRKLGLPEKGELSGRGASWCATAFVGALNC
ncbi:hypothetical protein ABZ615_24135 [Streptomyces sp. NPDC007325]|uniref:hypothetical protein n=1 Tax=Streptomyces sp. NPDC007325 TaxID=3154588 RepID=UPI0033EE2859